MVTMAGLWLPILLSAVFVFIASSLLHMVIPIHKGDFKKVPGEEKLLVDLRAHNLASGTYMFPCPGSMKDAGSPEMVAKYHAGPVGFMTIIKNGSPAVGKCLMIWFFYCVLISVFVGYAAMLALQSGAEYLTVFRFTGSVAILGYAFSDIPSSIWKGQSWTITFKFLFDGIIYGLVTAGTFGWLWPDGNIAAA